MAVVSANPFLLTLFISSLFLVPFLAAGGSFGDDGCDSELPIRVSDRDRLHVALNLEYLECEFFLHGAYGLGLDDVAPELARGGPPPIGARKANLDERLRKIFGEFGLQEVGHIRAITETVGGFPRPLLDLSREVFADIMNKAVGYKLEPPFDPYANSMNYLIACYVNPYVGLVGYVGTIPKLVNTTSKRLAAGLLGVEAGQDAVIRSLLYQIAFKVVEPYNKTVAEFTGGISELYNNLARCGIKDEGLIVPKFLGAENRTTSNVLSADPNSLSYARTPPEIFREVYGTGNESQPGAFYPRGGNGRIPRFYLSRSRESTTT